jgi:oxygen-independent coproporphyrinogen-3 oxidase
MEKPKGNRKIFCHGFVFLSVFHNFAPEMAGIYVHIPFCESRCVYCDFYSTTALAERQRYVDCLCREMRLRPLPEEGIQTVYLGGGTPSQLSSDQLRQLFDAIYEAYAVMADAEVTMECNPDDVTPAFVEALQTLPVNRVSMGAQTFLPHRLRFLRRRHTAEQVPEAVQLLRGVGIRNISVDLMYGFPDETLEEWEQDIQAAVALDVEHLSAYALQYEEGTPLYRMLERGEVKEVDEEVSRRMYYRLKDALAAAGFEHYEISNWGRPGYRSRHNSSYWNQTPYLGLGAAAHSFDGRNRQWNVADIHRYMAGMEKGEPCVEREVLTPDNRYNEMVMTALRTSEGLPMAKLPAGYAAYCLQQARRFVDDGLLSLDDHRLRLTRKGLFVSDMIMAELMRV